MDRPPPDADVVLDEDEIGATVARLAREVLGATGTRPLVVVPVLTGALFFGADLVRALRREGASIAGIHPLSCASYGDGTTSRGTPAVVGCPPRRAIEGRDVLVADTIVDSGRTLEALEAALRALAPASLSSVCLLDKVAARRHPVAPTFRGAPAPDRFLVGYGLDLAGRWREEPRVLALPGRFADR